MSASMEKHKRLESEVRDMKLKEEDEDMEIDITSAEVAKHEASASGISSMNSTTETPKNVKIRSRSPVKQQPAYHSPALKTGDEETIGGDVTVRIEPGKPPKLARTISHKVEKRPPQLLFAHDDKTTEASATFAVLSECTYANKYLGTTEHALECDCVEEWDPIAHSNAACGEDSDCINRATKMECVGDCGCGMACQNQRFQQKQYAKVTVIKTEKKGYGLRADTDLRPNDFIFEYIGEVIGENVFRRRMQQYDEEGIKHFYFMSLTKGEFVDATKRGNLGRFCNHSCNPNCYVDKWVVGDKLRMGIFAERKILAGEELVFNYNVDRYGADPQPCYCGEPNCTGYIGGKTQTDRGTKLSHTVIEALGIDDADAWDTAVAKRPRKKKAGEDDEEYVNNVEPRGLDEEGVNKVMSSLMQCKEKWIAVKLLTRIQRADDEKVRNRVVRFHGYRILKTALSNFREDVNVCLQILDILDKMPRLTKNKIQDSKIEEAVEPLRSHEDERVSSHAQALIEAWDKLEMAYRIPRVKRDPNATAPDRKTDRFDRREGERRRSKSRSRSKTPEKVHAPSGPRSNAGQRSTAFRPAPRFRPPPPSGPLPSGWFEATAVNGSVYYYNQQGTTTWQRPTASMGSVPPPPPPKAVSDQQMLNDLIKNIVANKKEPAKQPSAVPSPSSDLKKERKEDKWKSLPIEKQKKLYESALQPHIMHVVGKYKKKLAKDDLKRWAKEFAKQVVESDFRKDRVSNPNKISDGKAKDVKKHAQSFFDKAVKKKEAAERKKVDHVAKKDQHSHTPVGSPNREDGSPTLQDVDAALSEHGSESEQEENDTPVGSLHSPAGLKRRRDELAALIEDESSLKKHRIESSEDAASLPPPPPPPPPPPADDDVLDAEQCLTEFGEESNESTADACLAAKDAVSLHGTSFHAEPTQTATPPTTGSPDNDERDRALKRVNFAGMSEDRMRQLGIMDGAS